MEPFKLFHVSDSHITVPFEDPNGSKKYGVSRGLMAGLKIKQFDQSFVDRIFDDIKKLGPNHIVHTGDIGRFGRKKEFDEFFKVYNRHFYTKMGSHISSWLTVCPGNHDYYTQNHFIDDEFQDSFGITSKKLRPPYIKILQNRVVLIVIQTRHYKDASFTSMGSIEPNDLNIIKTQLKYLENLYNIENMCKILVMHHPPLKYRPTNVINKFFNLSHKDRKQVQEFLLEYDFDVCLCGHSHIARIYELTDESNNCVIVNAGSMTKRTEYTKPMYIILSIFDKKRFEIERREWNEEMNSFETK
jgi:predicted phosphodiesterase